MDIRNVLVAAGVVAAVGLIIAIVLSIAEKAFFVKTDDRADEVRGVLGGNNCGACGYAGCDALAKAIVNGEAPVNACPPAGQKGADKIAGIMGVEKVKSIAKTAVVRCVGTCEDRHIDFDFTGLSSCSDKKMALGRGEFSCSFGCLGCGDCAAVCSENAISVFKGVAVVDRSLCIACGMCVDECPQGIIQLVPADLKFAVLCSNSEKGKVTKKACRAGCLGCGICARNCPNDAVLVKNHLAEIGFENCDGCGLCSTKCPVKVIGNL